MRERTSLGNLEHSRRSISPDFMNLKQTENTDGNTQFYKLQIAYI